MDLDKKGVISVTEIWNLYDENRILTDKKHLRGEKLKQGEYHLVVHVCIFNNKKELLIQKRQPFKKGWPGMWDLSAAGSACEGETSILAAERETYEELGLKIHLQGVRPYFTMNFSNGFDDYYILEKEVEIASLELQTSEVAAVKWVNVREAKQLIKKGEMIPYIMLDAIFAFHELNNFYWDETKK